MLNALSLFSGAMGLDIGIEKSGINILGCIEINKYACDAIRFNRPKIPVIEQDISQLSVIEALKTFELKSEDIDIIIGGPPCQAFSVFGKRKGLNDIRGRVIFDYIRFVEEIKPKAFLLENVRGLMSIKISKDGSKGGLLKEILKYFNNIGYRVDLYVVNSVNYGAPQIRERILLFGNRLNLKADFPSPTHSDRPTKNQKKFVTLGDVIRTFNDPDPTLMDFSKRKKRYLSMIPPGGNWRSLPVEIQKESMGKSWYLKGGRSAYWRRLSFDYPSPTVVTMPNHAGTSMCHPEEIRALTVGECAAIQGFPPDWKFFGSPSEKYKQVGNAVPIILGEVAGKVLIQMLSNQNNSVTMPLENTVTHIRPHVRTRQYWKNGEVYTSEPYLNNQNDYYEERNKELLA